MTVVAAASLVVGLLLFMVSLFLLASGYGEGWFVGLIVGVVLFIGGFGSAAIEAEKDHCLRELRQISQSETKWVDGECYIKARDGRFVPLEWIEEGYNQ